MCQTLSFFAEDDRQTFVQANYLFEQEQYAQACDLYQSIDNKGFNILYNMSLAYLYQGDKAHAKLYGRRAEKQANFKQLTMLYELFHFIDADDSDENSSLSWYEQLALFLKKCILTISTFLVQVILLIVLTTLILFWYRSWYQIYKNLLLLLLIFSIFFGAIWCFKNSFMHQKIGIVTKNIIGVFAGPDESFYRKKELFVGDELIITKTEKKYYLIESKNVVGWIHEKDVEVV